MCVLDHLHAQLPAHASHYLIAYSGGLDSHVLLHAMHTLRDQHPGVSLRAVHVDHQLNASSQDWAVHCASVCADLSIPFVGLTVDVVTDNGESVEAEARKQRYQAMHAVLKPEEMLLTAHTQSDQAETLLLQLLRGAGVKGLSAMPVQKSLGDSTMVRPLLHMTRDDLQVYAKQHALQWVEDESNQDARFNRNFLRQAIVPHLQKRFPQFQKTLSRSARHCSEAATLLDELAVIDLEAAKTDQPLVLNVDALLALSPLRCKNVLRFWMHRNHFPLPSEKVLQQIVQTVLHSAQDAKPLVHWGGVACRRHRRQVYLMFV